MAGIHIGRNTRVDAKIDRPDLQKEKTEKSKNDGGILGGIGYVAGKLGTGLASIGEGISDAVVGTVQDVTGHDRSAAYTYGRSTVGDWNRSLDEWYNPSKGMQVAGDIASGVGQSVGYVALSAVPVVGTPLSLGAMAASGFGNGVSSAYQQTGKLGAKEFAYGALSAGTEIALEKFLGSTLAAGARIAGKGASAAAPAIGKNILKSSARSGAIKTVLTEASQEALEEFASTYTETLWLNATGVDTNASVSFSDALYNSFIGFASGGLMSGVSVGIKNAKNNARGASIIEAGNVNTLLNTAKYVEQSLGLDENIKNDKVRKRLSDELVQLKTSLDAYNNLDADAKEGARAKIYLGEIQESVLMIEIRAKAYAYADAFALKIEADPSKAQSYADTVTAVTGVEVSAEDIKNNTQILDKFGARDILGMIKFVGEFESDLRNRINADQARQTAVENRTNVGTSAGTANVVENVVDNVVKNSQISTEEATHSVNAEEAETTLKSAVQSTAGTTEVAEASEKAEAPKAEAETEPKAEKKTVSKAASKEAAEETVDTDILSESSKKAKSKYERLKNVQEKSESSAEEMRSEIKDKLRKERDEYLDTFEKTEKKAIGVYEKLKEAHDADKQISESVDNAKKDSAKQAEEKKAQEERERLEREAAEAEAKRLAEEKAEKERQSQRNYEAYRKAEREAILDIKDFLSLPNDIRFNIVRMYQSGAEHKSISKETKKALASMMAVRPDLHVYFTNNIEDNGAYTIQDGERVILINKDSGAVEKTIIHEITHSLRDEGSAAYESLEKKALSGISKEAKQELTDRYMVRHLIDYDLLDEGATVEEAHEVFKTLTDKQKKDFANLVDDEITANFVASALNSKKFLEKHGKEHRNAIARAIAQLRSFGAAIFNRSDADKALRELEMDFTDAAFPTEAEKEKFAKFIEEWEKEESIRREISDITSDDVETIRAIGKKSINDFTKEDLGKAEKWARKFYAELGTKSPFFRAWFGDWREHDTKTKASVIPIKALSLNEKAEVEQYIKKGLKEKSLFRGNVRNKDTDFDINIGVQVYNDTLTYANREYSRDKDFDSYLARITLLSNIKELTEKSVLLDTETVTPKDNIPKQTFMHVFYSAVNINGKNYLAKVKVDELDADDTTVRRAYNVNNIEISPVAVTRDFSPAGTTDDIGGDSLSINSISDLFAFVKTYDKDFSPNPSSAIRNADGTTKIMYHGSPAQFSTFDKKKAKSSGLYGRGFYFTDSDSHAKTYGNTYAVYLDVKSPLSEGSETVTTKQIRKFLESVAENEDYSIENYGTYDIDTILKKITSRDAFAVLNDINATAIGDLVEATKLWNEVNGTKFDGIVVPTETVVFEPTQIKSATDNIGTFSKYDPDIRRSLSNEDISARIVSKVDNRSRGQRMKDAVTEVRSRSFKENASVAKSKGQSASEGLAIQLTNAQAGIENYLTKYGMAKDDAESITDATRRASKKATGAIEIKQTDFYGNIIGDALDAIFTPVRGNRDFSIYLLHKLNTTRAPRGKAVFADLTAEDSQKAIQELEKKYPKFKDVAENLSKFDDNMLQFAVDAGLISQEQKDAYRALNPYYVPLQRLKDTDPSTFKSGAFRVKGLNKAAVGGDAMIVDPIEAYVEHVYAIYKNGYTNAMALELFNRADGVDVKVARDKIPDFAKELDDEGREQLVNMTQRDTIDPKSNTIVLFNGGEAVAMDVSKNIMEGFKATRGEQAHYFDTPLGKVNTKAMKLFTNLVTSWNPIFIIRNAFRDFQDAGIYSRYGFTKFSRAYVRAMSAIAKNSDLWQEYVANGAFATSIIDYNIENAKAFSKRGFKTSDSNIAKPWNTFQNAQILIEQLPRFAEYMLSREAGNNVQTSLYYAADVTVNFARGGKLTKTLGKTVMPFLNPAFQGLSKNVRVFSELGDKNRRKRAAKKLFVSATILGIAPIVLSNLMYGDDEDYEILDDDLKSNYYLAKIGDKFIRIPRGRLASAFASVTNTTQAQITEGEFDGGQWLDSFDNVLSQSTPMDSISRTIFSPIMDAKTNTTWYGGVIESQAYDHVAPKDRYDEYTSAIAKWLGSVFNDSPKKIDYVLDQYSGVIGDFLLPLTADTRKQSSIGETVFSSLITDPVYSNKLSKDFYEMYDEVDWGEDNLENYQVKKHLDAVKQAVNELYKEIDKINEDESLSSAEKVKRAKETRAMINQLYKTAIDDYDAIRAAAQASEGAYGTVFETIEVTSDNYRALDLDKSDIGAYAITVSYGNEHFVTQTRETEQDAADYIERIVQRDTYADMNLIAYGSEAAIKAYSSDFYEKAQVANSLGIDYNTIYSIISETKYLAGTAKKDKVNDIVRTLPLTASAKSVIKYIFGDSTKNTKTRVASAIKKADIDEDTKMSWLRKLQK